MDKLFWGFFFVMLDFNFTIDYSVIGLLPDFIGFILLLKGIDQLQEYSVNFVKIRPWVFGMIIVTVITYVMDIFSIGTVSDQPLLILIGLILLAIGLYIQYNIIFGIQDMENALRIALNGEKLYLIWKIAAVCGIFSYVALVFPAVAVIFILITVVADLVFLYNLYQSKKIMQEHI